MAVKRPVYLQRLDRDEDRKLKGREIRAHQTDMKRFDAWPEVHAAWLIFLRKQTYHREWLARQDRK